MDEGFGDNWLVAGEGLGRDYLGWEGQVGILTRFFDWIVEHPMATFGGNLLQMAAFSSILAIDHRNFFIGPSDVCSELYRLLNGLAGLLLD